MNYIREINAFYDWLETNTLSDSAIALWHALMHINNKTGWKPQFAVAISVLEAKTGLKRSAVFTARNRLQQVGRISFQSRSGQQSALYTMHSLLINEPCVQITDTNPNANPNTNPNANPTLTQTINKLNKTKLTLICSEIFDQWWEHYPRKVSKQDAKKAWNKTMEVINKPDHYDADEEMLTPADIVMACKEFAKWCQKNKKEVEFLPYPATWLNKARYKDFAYEVA